MNCSEALRQQLHIYFINYPEAALLVQPNHRINPTRWEVLVTAQRADQAWPDQGTVGWQMKDDLLVLFRNLDRSLISSGWSLNSSYRLLPDGRIVGDSEHRFNFNQTLLLKWRRS